MSSNSCYKSHSTCVSQASISIVYCPFTRDSAKVGTVTSVFLGMSTALLSVSSNLQCRDASFFDFLLSGEASDAKLGTKRRYTLQKPTKPRISDTVAGYCGILISSVVFCATRERRGAVACPAQSIAFLKKKKLFHIYSYSSILQVQEHFVTVLQMFFFRF